MLVTWEDGIAGRLSSSLPAWFVQLFRQRRGAGDGESGLRFGFRFLRLGAAQGERVFAGEDGAFALIVDAGNRARIDL